MSQTYQLNEQKLKKAFEIFSDYSKESRFKDDIKERLERKQFFQKFAREKFSELNFSEMIKKLWGAQIWSNKDYLINKIIKNNGIEKLTGEFTKLVSLKDTPGERYQRYLENIRDMGPAMVTEIICYLDPQNAGIWNDKARKALGWLEAENIPYDKYRITGKEYDDFNAVLKGLANDLKGEGYKDVDLLFVDYFLWEIWDKFARHEKTRKPFGKAKGKPSSKHDELRDKVAEIGSWLGFEVETEKFITTGARVDVVWRARIANLGAVSYIFEVQDRGSIDSLIVNLQRAQINPTVQKLIIISDTEQIAKIQNEIKTMPENFRKITTFWGIEEVENTHQSLEQVTTSITKLHLVEE
jgi:hypothetical protein